MNLEKQRRSELGDKALITSAKALANTAYRLITEEGLLEKVKEEFREAQRNQGKGIKVLFRIEI